MANRDLTLMAHLMRRAGFGAPYDELEARAAKGYEATVEELLSPEAQSDLPLDLLYRYYLEWNHKGPVGPNQIYWTYRMINSPRPLEEKMSLFWHGIFCVGDSKCMNALQVGDQLTMFRSHGLDRFPEILRELSRDPSMLYYLDNCMSHKGATNENWGRELLELFSMGVGMDGNQNYTEDDVKECARAFTGWTVGNAIPLFPYGKFNNRFIYDPDDHDDDRKTFLGETGRFNGDDIIEIICKQPATARFISRHLYNFFVADECQVPAWQNTPPRDSAAIKKLEDEYFSSKYDIRSMLRVLFNSDFFKEARFSRIKSPAEVVIGTLRLVGEFNHPRPGLLAPVRSMRYMGQALLNPPSVEGWHTGAEWVDSGTLVERVNFIAGEVGKINAPEIRAIINRLASEGYSESPERLLDRCLEMLGGYQLTDETRSLLITQLQKQGTLQPGTEEFAQRVGQLLQMIVSTQEYQFA